MTDDWQTDVTLPIYQMTDEYPGLLYLADRIRCDILSIRRTVDPVSDVEFVTLTAGVTAMPTIDDWWATWIGWGEQMHRLVGPPGGGIICGSRGRLVPARWIDDDGLHEVGLRDDPQSPPMLIYVVEPSPPTETGPATSVADQAAAAKAVVARGYGHPHITIPPLKERTP